VSVAPGPSEILAGVGALAARVQPLGLALGAPLATAGLAALSVGTRHRRALATAGLAAVGALASAALREPVAAHLGVSAAPAAVLLAVAGALGGALVPAAFPFGVAALAGALAGAHLPLGGRPELGAAAGGLAIGIVGLLLSRLVSAVAASLGGALVLGLGLLACLKESALARELAGRPAAVVAFAVVVGNAGAALQLSAGTATSRAGPAARSPGSPP
jgi:hypothetical protein